MRSNNHSNVDSDDLMYIRCPSRPSPPTNT